MPPNIYRVKADAAFNDNKDEDATPELGRGFQGAEVNSAHSPSSGARVVRRLTWFKSARSDLKRGKIVQLLEQMKQPRKSIRGSRRKNLTSQINYFNKRLSKGLFNYDKITQLNLPIGSGAVESLIRQAVNLRLKGNGKFWLKSNAEIILHARCQWLKRAWNNFTNSILTRRIYPATS